MTYGIETREVPNKTKRMLRVAEMKTLRTVMGKTRIDRIRNTDIREQYGVQDIVRWGSQRKRYWYAHVREGWKREDCHASHLKGNHLSDGRTAGGSPPSRGTCKTNRSRDLKYE